MSKFNETTSGGEKEENPFTSFYGQLLHQGNMLADYVRTGTYQKAIYDNSIDFNGKVVLDVGTGTGILAYFAIQAGAKIVYAVDASDAVHVATSLAVANNYADRIKIIKGRIEDISLPEKVDIIISEPIGFLLVHERMLESYVVARDRFLKPDGLMMPTTGTIVLCPFSDDTLYKEQVDRVKFWETTNFYGLDLSCLVSQARAEYFSQPIVGIIPADSLISNHRTEHVIDFGEVLVEELHEFEIPYTYVITKTALLHGLAGWFDISFNGSAATVVLSTAPELPGTHWYQCRMLFKDPIAVNRGQTVSGIMQLKVNDKFSYDITMTIGIDGTEVKTESNINLKDQLPKLSILFTAVIPKGSRGGDTITVTANGATGLVRVPNGLSAGQIFRYKFSEMTITQAAPTQPSHFPANFQQIAPINPNSASQFTAQVPPGVLPGQPFEVNVNGLRVQLICPPNSYPGMQFVAQIPNQQPSGPLNQPPPQNMYAPQQQLYSPQQNPSNQPAFSAQPIQINPSVQQQHSPQPQQPQQQPFNQPNQPLHVPTQPFNPHFVAQNNIPVAVAEMVHDEPKHYGKV